MMNCFFCGYIFLKTKLFEVPNSRFNDYFENFHERRNYVIHNLLFLRTVKQHLVYLEKIPPILIN